MKQRDALAATTVPTISLDPRTKILLLAAISVFVLGGTGGKAMAMFSLILSAVPLLLLLAAKHWKAAAGYVLVYVLCYVLSLTLLPITKGAVNYALLFICGLSLHFMPGLMMGYFVIATTTVSEFVAAMERMHVTEKIVIPMSVVFRFFPTVIEELFAISDAMRMRGIRFGGGKASAMLEYRMVPMMNCSLKIGEELSAAALTRGLGAPIKRTNICQIGFHCQDVVMLLLCTASFLYFILSLLHIV